MAHATVSLGPRATRTPRAGTSAAAAPGVGATAVLGVGRRTADDQRPEVSRPPLSARFTYDLLRPSARHLRVSEPSDSDEREAELAAERVLRGDPTPSLSVSTPALQRTCARCVQEDEPRVQRAAASPSGSVGVVDTSAAAGATQSTGSPLPAHVRAFFEPRFRLDFANVRIHHDGEAARAARSIDAHAFTLGSHIVFGRDRYAPETSDGRRLLAHELAHVAQQRGGNPPRIHRFVDEAAIGCGGPRGAGTIRFQHDGRTDEYVLEHCDVTPGTYDNVQVHLTSRGIDFDLGLTERATQFDFRYAIGPGQSNPARFFAGQTTVRMVAAPASESGAAAYRFSVKSLSDAEVRALAGVSTGALPEGVMVPVGASPTAHQPEESRAQLSSLLPPAMAAGAYFSPTPFSFLPPNTTGVLWTQGHTSIWANPQGALLPTLRGYRGNLGYYLAELLPSVGRNFTVRLHEGVPGTFANDAVFPLMPGQQSYLYVLRDADHAARFAETLRTTSHGGQYTYSPPRAVGDAQLGPVGESELAMYEILSRRGRAPMCTNNCITVPASTIEGALGTRPTTSTGVDVMSGRGPSGVVDPHHAGRGRLMSEAMREGPLPPGVGRLNLRVTLGGSASMFLIRGGGRVLLVYGIHQSLERIHDAATEGHAIRAVAEEGGSWAGAILASAIGGAAAGALVCAPTGPVDAVCVVGGFLGGALFGVVGGAIGHEVGHEAGTAAESAVDAVTAPVLRYGTELMNYMDYNIRQLYGVPF